MKGLFKRLSGYINHFKNRMKDLLKQFSGLFSTGFAATCCLGMPLALSALGATGLGFLATDLYLFPLFVGSLSFTLWLLSRSSRNNGNRKPFWLGLTGGGIATIALFLVVIGMTSVLLPIYLGLGLLIIATGWDFIIRRKSGVCALDKCQSTDDCVPA